MSVNLDNVKAIVHNNKNVVKIENSHGIVWQKTPEPTRDILYYINSSTIYKLDMKNKVGTQYSIASGASGGNGGMIIGTNSKLYKFYSGQFYPITIDDTNNTFTFGSSECSVNDSNYNGNQAHCYPATRNFQLYATRANSTTIKDISTPVPPSGWTVTDLTDTIKGNCTFVYNGTMYGSTQASGVLLSKWDPTSGWVSQSVFTNLPSNCYAYHVWVLGNRVFCDNGSNHYEYNFTNKTWDTHTWTGLSSFNGARVFTDGVDIYEVGGTGSSTSIHILDPSTDTWSQYWTFSVSIRGDYIINSKGSAQLAQTARPRLA